MNDDHKERFFQRYTILEGIYTQNYWCIQNGSCKVASFTIG